MNSLTSNTLRLGVAVFTFGLLASAGGCSEKAEDSDGAGGGSGLDPDSRYPGGETTNELLLGSNAFKEHATNILEEHESLFFSGNSFFNSAWVEAPSSTTGRDGLGPLFNARSCSACHLNDGRGRPPLSADEELVGLLFRIGTGELAAHGAPEGDPNYGDQFQPFSLPDVPVEAKLSISWETKSGTFPDGESYELSVPHYELIDGAHGDFVSDLRLSPRAAPFMIGLGLLEAIPEMRLEALSDPEDEDGDGISGRLNHVWDVSENAVKIGRFGWKAEQPSIAQQTAGAFLGDMGLTTPIFGSGECSPVQIECAAMPNGGEPEVSDETFAKVVLYSRLLAPPIRERFDEPEIVRGQKLFEQVGCDGCHVSRHETGDAVLPELSNQVIWPYTDLLLHDLGEDLSDHRPSFEAAGSEWRTPPLWGVGRIGDVNGHDRLLHDGRARGVQEAILWHAGEGEAARKAFEKLSKKERADLIDFVESL